MYQDSYDYNDYKVEEEIVEEVPEVVEEETVTTQEAVSGDMLGKVNYTRLNVREKPDSKSKVIKIINKDDLVTVLDDVDIWYHVSLEDGTIGYCMQEYIDLI